MVSPVGTQRLGAAGASQKGSGEAVESHGQSEGVDAPRVARLPGEGIGSGKLEVSGYRTLVEELSMTGAQFLDLVVR